jgi:hypothetical protein
MITETKEIDKLFDGLTQEKKEAIQKRLPVVTAFT